MLNIMDALLYIPFGLLAGIIFTVIREIWFKVNNEWVSWFHRILTILFGLYLTMVFALTISPLYGFREADFGNSVNIIPLKVLAHIKVNPKNFWGNILLFIPIGMFPVLMSNMCQKLYVTTLIGAGLSFIIEALQLFSLRSTDIDDIILNTTGTLWGYFIGRIILYIMPSLRRKIGVRIKVDNKYYRRKRDAGGIVLLATLILISVYISGFSIRTADRAEGRSLDNSSEEVLQPDRPDDIRSDDLGTKDLKYKDISNNNIEFDDISNNDSRFDDLDARNVYLLNVSTNTVLYEKESKQRIAPASTTKMLTALTALDYCDEDEEIKIGREIDLIAQDASRAWLTVGSRLNLRQLLVALLLPSGNDAAYSLAVYTGRKICEDETLSIDRALKAFMTAMNKKAADIGAFDSNFVSPDGYDTEGQYTTAYDLACIAKACMESEILKGIVGCYRISDVWLSGQEVTYYNTNELINPESPYYYEYAVGLKTGNSGAAGACLVSCAYINDELYICVVMGSTEQGRWLNSLTLYHSIK